MARTGTPCLQCGTPTRSTSGLCPPCKQPRAWELGNDDILEDGEWVLRGLTRVWVPRPRPVTLLVCRVCAATEGEVCRYPSGHARKPHRKGRIPLEVAS